MHASCRLLFLSIIISIFFLSLGDIVQDLDDDDIDSNGNPSKRRMINFASHQAGAVIIDKYPPNGKGFNNLLNDDRDKYAICSSTEKKWVVIGLSEEVVITSIAIANYEKYSSTVREFQLLGSLKYPTSEWNDLGTYFAQLMLGEQHFNLTSTEVSHTRYLKVKFLSHYLDEELFTLSQIKVYGQTVFASLQEEVARSDENDIKLLLQEDVQNLLRTEDPLLSGNESVDIPSESTVTQANEDMLLPLESLSDNSSFEFSHQDSASNTIEVSNNSKMEEDCEQLQPVLTESAISAENSAINSIQEADEEEIATENAEKEEGMERQKDEVNFGANNNNLVIPMEDVPIQEEEILPPITEESDDSITVEHETSGQVERLQFNRTEWSIVLGALQRSNLTVDFLKSTIQSIKQMFVDPLSQRMDVDNLERFIASQDVLPAKAVSAEETKDDKTSPEILGPQETSTNSHEVQPNFISSNLEKDLSSEVEATLSGKESDSTDSKTINENISHESQDSENVSSTSSESLVLEPSNNSAAQISSVSSNVAVDSVNQHGGDVKSSEEQVAYLTDSNTVTSDKPAPATETISTDIMPTTQPDSSSSHEVFATSETNIISEVNVNNGSAEPEATSPISATEGATSANQLGASGSSSMTSSSTPTFSSSKAPQLNWLNCLDQLKFSDFQARMMAKLQHKNSSEVSTNMSSSQTDLSHSGNNNNNNIFKQIIQRMKNLEANQAISEIYLSQLSDCLRMLRDEMIERQHMQHEHDVHARQNPLGALFTLSLTPHNLSNSCSASSTVMSCSPAGSPMHFSSTSQQQQQNQHSAAPHIDVSSSAAVIVPSQVSPFLLPLLAPPEDSVPVDAFWSRMAVFLRTLTQIMIKFIWVVIMSSRQDQARLLTSTLQELRHLLQTSVIEFWCALVCALVISLVFGLVFAMSMGIWLLFWCCCGPESHQRDGRYGKRRFSQ